MINFLCTSPTPKIESTDAVYNEIELLRSEFGGNVLSLYPFRKPSSRVPVEVYGFSKIRQILQNEKQSQLNHIYGGGFFYLPILHMLKKPIVYTVAGGLSDRFRIPYYKYLKKLTKVIVSNERDYSKLQSRGIKSVEIVKPSINIKPFGRNILPLEKNQPLKFMFASAPWELKQFDSKCVSLILESLQEIDNIHITLLWRGLFLSEVKDLISKYNISEKVTLIEEFADINKVLTQSHGAILLAKDSTVVKSYPHSLIESIICGKPVLTSKEIPIADFVNANKCGFVLNQLNKSTLIAKFKDFRENYTSLTTATLDIAPDTFANENKLKQYKSIYDQVL